MKITQGVVKHNQEMGESRSKRYLGLSKILDLTLKVGSIVSFNPSQDKRSNLHDHLEALSEEHLRKTWSKLLKTTERLNELEAVEGQIAELQTDKESMKMLLDGNSEEISDLKLSAKKLEVENMALKRDVAALQKHLEEVKFTAACDKEEVRSLKAEHEALKKDVEEVRNSKAYREEVKRAQAKYMSEAKINDWLWESEKINEESIKCQPDAEEGSTMLESSR